MMDAKATGKRKRESSNLSLQSKKSKVDSSLNIKQKIKRKVKLTTYKNYKKKDSKRKNDKKPNSIELKSDASLPNESKKKRETNPQAEVASTNQSATTKITKESKEKKKEKKKENKESKPKTEEAPITQPTTSTTETSVTSTAFEHAYEDPNWIGNEDESGSVASGAMEEDFCWECGQSTLNSTNWNNVLLCDVCEGEYHLHCSGLERIPRTTFVCKRCIEEKEAFQGLNFNVSDVFKVRLIDSSN
jgi:hypothetical protein